MKKRNSLIELYRFLFAMNVVKGHGFWPVPAEHFGPARVSVEFFFILSGFLFIRSLEKWRELPMKAALGKMLRSKLSPILIPTVIGLVSNIAYNIVTKEYFSGIWGYLWYVHAMVVVFFAYVILHILIKKDKPFFYTVAAIFVIATLMRFSGAFYSWGYVRGACTISLGMLLGLLPKIRLKHQNLLWIPLVPIIGACFAAVCFELGNLRTPGGFMWFEVILNLVLYPALIYLSFQLDFSFAPFNYLGALSFGLYAFQCPADLLRELGVSGRYLLFGVIVGLSVIEDGIKRLYRIRRRPRAEGPEASEKKTCSAKE